MDICKLKTLLSPTKWFYYLSFWNGHFKIHQKINEWRTEKLHTTEISRASPKYRGKGRSLLSALDESVWCRLHSLVVLYKPESPWQEQLHTWVVTSSEEYLAVAGPETPLLLLVEGIKIQINAVMLLSSPPGKIIWTPTERELRRYALNVENTSTFYYSEYFWNTLTKQKKILKENFIK